MCVCIHCSACIHIQLQIGKVCFELWCVNMYTYILLFWFDSYIHSAHVLVVIRDVPIRYSTETNDQPLEGERPSYFHEVVAIPPNFYVCCTLRAGKSQSHHL